MDSLKIKILLKRNFYYFLDKSKFLFNNYFGKYKYTFGRDWFYKSEIYQKAKNTLEIKTKIIFKFLKLEVLKGYQQLTL